MDSIIVTGLVAGLVALSTLVVTLYGARKLGLTDLQKAVRREEEKLVSTLKDRVTYLEQENERLVVQVATLTTENAAQAARIDALEQKIADLALGHPLRPLRGTHPTR